MVDHTKHFERRIISTKTAKVDNRRQKNISESIQNEKKHSRKIRGYAAAGQNRLTMGWLGTNKTADSEIKRSLKTLRARSRDLAMNNDYARRYLKIIVANVIGSKGITFQSKAKDPGGQLDTIANKIIEDRWNDWCKNPTICGLYSWVDTQRVTIDGTARDGEMLIRLLRSKSLNKYGFALQLIEADHLDEQFNDENKRIRSGIEFDEWGKPVAYWIFTVHPGADNSSLKQERIRIPADEIIHVYFKDRPSQNRGVPWTTSAMTRINNLGGYEEAEIIAARASASKMGFLEKKIDADPDYTGDDEDDENIFIDAQPGTFEQLPVGWSVTPWDPQHPSGNFGPFIKSTLRGIAAGLGISYNKLANDLENVNYSSLREGSLDERDHFRVIQTWFCETVCQPIFEAWLDMALLMGAVNDGKTNLPFSKREKYNAAVWQPRGWDWVDPEKDINSTVLAIQSKLTTHSRACAERGVDFEDILKEMQEDQKLAEKYGFTTLVQPGAQPGKNTEAGNGDSSASAKNN